MTAKMMKMIGRRNCKTVYSTPWLKMFTIRDEKEAFVFLEQDIEIVYCTQRNIKTT